MTATLAAEAVRGYRAASGRVWISYARLSKANERRQDGYGSSVQIGEQHANNRAYIGSVDPDHGPIIELSDDGYSAFLDVYRPEFETALRMIGGREVGAFVAWHADRASRQVGVTARLWAIADVAGVQIHTALGGQHKDPDSLYFETMIAERESRQKRNRMLESHKGRAKEGRPSGGPRAYGYGPGMAVIETEAAIIRDLAARALNGESLGSLTRSLNERGIPTTRVRRKTESGKPGTPYEWREPVVKRLLTNPTLAGIRSHTTTVDGEKVTTEHPGAWAPIIDVPTHKALVHKLTDPGRRTSYSTANKYLLSGLARCGECESVLRGSHIGRVGRDVYRCVECHAVSRVGAPIDEMAADYAVARLAELDETGLLASDENRRNAEALTLERAGVEAERRDLLALLKAGKLSAAGFAAGDAALEERDAEIDRALSTLAEAAAAPQRALEGATGDAAARVWAEWDADTTGAGLARQRAVIGLLLDIRVYPAGRGARKFNPATVRITYRDLT